MSNFGRESELRVATLLHVLRGGRATLHWRGAGDVVHDVAVIQVKARHRHVFSSTPLPDLAPLERSELLRLAREAGKVALLAIVIDSVVAFKFADGGMWANPADLRQRHGAPVWLVLPPVPPACRERIALCLSVP